ncbi:hypothetical protein EsH8_X_000682 [Colletotrichum jinshuiense]
MATLSPIFSPDATSFLAGLAVYQLLNRVLHKLARRLDPAFYATLELDKSRKLAPYFVFPVGLLVTLVTAPICLSAYNETPPATDVFAAQRPFTTSGKICLASRGVLWISELPLLSYSPEYFAHHVLALASLLVTLVQSAPRRPFYLIYAGLATEIFSDTIALLRHHGRNAGNSSVFRRAMVANVVTMVVLRIVPIAAFAATMPRPSPDFIAGVTMYCVYLARLTYIQLRTLGFIGDGVDQTAGAGLSGKEPAKPTSAMSLFQRPITLVVCVAAVITSMSVNEYFKSFAEHPAMLSSRIST